MKTLRFSIIFSLFISLGCFAENYISPNEARLHVGELKTVCGQISTVKHSTGSSGRPYFINLGLPYPNHVFTVVVWDEAQNKIGLNYGKFVESSLCVKGQISLYRGVAQIVVKEKSQLWLKQ